MPAYAYRCPVCGSHAEVRCTVEQYDELDPPICTHEGGDPEADETPMRREYARSAPAVHVPHAV